MAVAYVAAINEIKTDYYLFLYKFTGRFKRMETEKYENMYIENKDFKEYVDNYMRNKNIDLKDVLRLKHIQLVGDVYKGDNK